MKKHIPFLGSILLLTVTILIIQLLSQTKNIPLLKDLIYFPGKIGNYDKKEDISFDPQTVRILAATDYLQREYISNKNQRLNLFIGYYASQKQGKQIHSPKHCLPGSGWEETRYQNQWIPIPAKNGQGITVNKYLVSKGLENNLVLYWYQSRGRVNTNEYLERLYLVWDAIYRKRTDGAIVRITVPFNEKSKQQVLNDGIKFVQELTPILDTFLPS
jgi:EpsI family protein